MIEDNIKRQGILANEIKESKKRPIGSYPVYTLKNEIDEEYTKNVAQVLADKQGDGEDIKRQRKIATKYGFMLPPLGGEPESFLLRVIEHNKEAGEALFKHPDPLPFSRITEGAAEINSKRKEKRQLAKRVMKGN